MVEIRHNLVDGNKWGVKCPYEMKPKYVVIHNTDNDASAENEVAYMRRNDNEVSFHYAVDDKEIVQGILEDRNAWHAGDGGKGQGNRYGIAIEICYSKSGGAKFEAAEKNAAELAASILKCYGWGIDRLKKHQDFNGKYCPRRTLDLGWQRFVDMVIEFMGGKPKEKPGDVIYCVYAAGKWWPDITNYNNDNSNGYAGVTGHPIQGLRIEATDRDVHYRVHTVGGSWLEPIKNRNGSGANSYAGIYGKNIDGVQIKTSKGKVKYRVHLADEKRWLAWVIGENEFAEPTGDGYAGIFGKRIDEIQIAIE